MCGICGIVGLKDKEVADKSVTLMNLALAHRGPDDEGVFIDNGIALGHRRLSIIDLSKNGHQPMTSADGRFVIVYNGELYNFKSLRFDLQRARVGDKDSISYPFQTQTDTEVILASYQRWGADCLKYFNGMFAFAIWDNQKEELFIARDRLGIKPLYYWQPQTPEGVLNSPFGGQRAEMVFASEIRTLLKSNLVPKKLDRSAVCDYVAFQTVHAPATIIEDVKMLLPGHYILIKKGESNSSATQHKYWALQDITMQSPVKPYDEICKDVNKLFFAAVERRLVADVPFGAFLSGGIDSSLVVAVMSKLMRDKVRTFSVTFDESEFNEGAYAAQVAKQYNTEHHDIKLSPQDCLSKLPEAISSMDHPSGDGINTYIVSEATKKAGITMALSGLGSDELFAGYPLFKRLHRLEKLKWVSGFPFVSFPFQIMNMIKPSPASTKLVEMAGLPNWGLSNTYPITREIFTKKQMEVLLNSIASINRELLFSKHHGVLSKISVAELSNYLPDILLRDTDQMSMAHALEVRVPFLDYTLVEYVLGLPDEVKYPHTPKKLLTDAMKGLLPSTITNRKKMGFAFPWSSWMKNDLKAFCEKNINSLSEREYFNENNLQSLWSGFLKNNSQYPYYKIWHLIILENWIKENNIDA